MSPPTPLWLAIQRRFFVKLKRRGISVNHSQNIPFLDLVTPHVELEQELTAVFQQVIRTAGFIGGPMVDGFEKAFATFCDTKYSVAVNSGTDALRFALMACGLQTGDVVVTVPHTFIATTEAISQAERILSSSTSTSKRTTWIPRNLRQYLETQCTKENSGKLVSRRSGRPVDRRCSGPPLRANGRYGRHSRIG